MLNLTKAFLFVTLLFSVSGRANAEDYAARYKQLQDQHADAQVEPLLAEWRAKAPNDPEAWIASANYYFNQRQVNISTKKAGKGDFTLTDKKTGKQAGSISFEQDKGNMKRAADLLQEATTKFPDRLDIWCGLAFIYQENGDFESEMSILQKMVAYAREHPAQLKWLKSEPLKDPTDKFVPEKLHNYGIYYEKKDTPGDDQRFLKMAMFATEQYPNHPFAYNDVALYYSNTGDRKKTREWLEKAHQVDPKDGLVMFNLGRISAEAGNKAAARKWYEESIKADPEGEHVEAAKEALKKMKK